MINHVVLFKLKDYAEDEKKAVLSELKSLLVGLKKKIDVIRYIEVGINYELDAKSHDICLISHFDSVDDLDRYRVHPEHLKVVERVSETTVSRAAVDFEF